MHRSKSRCFRLQSVANIMYASGKLQRPPRSSVCAKVESFVQHRHADFKDTELANILFSFTKARYEPGPLFSIIEDR